MRVWNTSPNTPIVFYESSAPNFAAAPCSPAAATKEETQSSWGDRKLIPQGPAVPESSGMWKRPARWFKVTFLSASWRSLNLWKGHLTIPKRSQRIARWWIWILQFFSWNITNYTKINQLQCDMRHDYGFSIFKQSRSTRNNLVSCPKPKVRGLTLQ